MPPLELTHPLLPLSLPPPPLHRSEPEKTIGEKPQVSKAGSRGSAMVKGLPIVIKIMNEIISGELVWLWLKIWSGILVE